ncbi:40S ribosomal protein S20 [Staphylotrichum longicolle]|uniref:Small ribosomal subunit protein uS10 n=1 Tax=Staphylotrichum longicolle TaxID=669026 RepID=A0AAD4HVF2_9PEZI|nr:40S ribosomal protein S20 [Staphylotrichum longicolle]
MSYNKPEKEFGEAPKVHKIRITLTSRKVQALEKVCQELIERAKNKDLRAKGPVRLPTKTLKIMTRKTPCGEGSKTWDLYEMRIHKRLIDLTAPTEIVKQIIITSRLVSRLRLPLLLKQGEEEGRSEGTTKNGAAEASVRVPVLACG